MKKDILKKRIILEKELQIEIQKELATELASRVKEERTKQEDVKPVPTTPATPATQPKRRYEHISLITFELA